jgi:ABC-2 type transport system ATP-binding protein
MQEIVHHYAAGDTSLSVRRLLDFALDTQDLRIFEETLQFVEWEEKNGTISNTTAIERLTTLVAAIAAVPVKANNSPETLISVTDIGKDFSNFKLQNINLEIKKGELIGLVGENGNGKTTLLRMIAGDLKLSSGSINYHFIPEGTSDYSIKSQLVYMPQRIPKWRGSIMDNLQFTLSCHQVYGEENRIWAEMFLARLGLRLFRTYKWDAISSGYKTRFELAKVLLQKPKIILLDEPLANLDINAQQTILQDLKFLAQSKSAPFSMVLSSQQLYEVERISDKIIFLKNGIPQYLNNTTKTFTEKEARDNQPPAIEVIYELETTVDKEILKQAFAAYPIDQVHYNGGVYFIHFKGTISNKEVLQCLIDASIEVNYLRNISNSSRRFFITN